MADIEINVTGFKELQAALEKLGGDEARAIVREGLKAGAIALQDAMMIGSSTLKGEAGAMLRERSSWSKSVRMKGDLVGVTRVRPKGSLPEIHTGTGKGMQGKGVRYRRSLAYLVKIAEFGGGHPADNWGRHFPMTSGYESNIGSILDRVISVIKERLKI
jgi:hypothetical protein